MTRIDELRAVDITHKREECCTKLLSTWIEKIAELREMPQGMIVLTDLQINYEYNVKDGVIKLRDVQVGPVTNFYNENQLMAYESFVKETVYGLAKYDLLIRLRSSLKDASISKVIDNHSSKKEFSLGQIDKTFRELVELGKPSLLLMGGSPSKACEQVSRVLQDHPNVSSFDNANEILAKFAALFAVTPTSKPST